MNRLSRHYLEQILAHSSDGIVVVDARGPNYAVVYANPAYQSMSGFTADELSEQGLPLLSGGRLTTSEKERLISALADGERFETTLSEPAGIGGRVESQVRVDPLRSTRGAVKFFLLSQRSKTVQRSGGSGVEVGVLQREIKRARMKLEGMNRLDAVTGLYRHESFLELADRDCRMARREKKPVAVIVLQIVDLEAYAQTFGSKAVDSCLRMIAAQVNGVLRRASDLCARADEHGLIALTHGQDLEEARALAARIADNIRGLGLHNPRGRFGRYISAQIGVASEIPDATWTRDMLIDAARDDLANSQPSRGASLHVSA